MLRTIQTFFPMLFPPRWRSPFVVVCALLIVLAKVVDDYGHDDEFTIAVAVLAVLFLARLIYRAVGLWRGGWKEEER